MLWVQAGRQLQPEALELVVMQQAGVELVVPAPVEVEPVETAQVVPVQAA